ncbi:MAG: hypothetical protein MRY21_01060 [Simkaniaceae bacterium]|nr:hypothetical protein [Simkaniaceae bacterium]
MPKQFLRLNFMHSLLTQTLSRFEEYERYVITANQWVELAQSQAKGARIICEPVAAGTLAAIVYAIEQTNLPNDALVLVSPSDTLVEDQALASALPKAVEKARSGKLVSLSVKPRKISTKYGYLKAGRFIEKPSFEKAKEYVESGEYFWNTGMLLFEVGTFKKELKPTHHTSVDRGLLEQSNQTDYVLLDGQWHDVGSWEGIYDASPKDLNHNVILGEGIELESVTNSLIISDKPLQLSHLQGVALVNTNHGMHLSRLEEKGADAPVESKCGNQQDRTV